MPPTPLALALNAAIAAGEEILAMRASSELKISSKTSSRNLVTTADLRAEKIIIDAIRSQYPEHAILAEESSPHLSDREALNGPLWVIDPIDGTMNYAHGHLQVGVSIAFCDKGRVQAGVVHAPFMGETFAAELGRGATLNGKKITSSPTSILETSLIATGFPEDRESIAEIMSKLTAVIENCRDLRRLGAASLDVSWVACGRLEGFYETINAWDIAAAGLIAREAGARTGNLIAQPDESPLPPELFATWYVAAAAGIYDDFVELLNRN